MTVDALSPLAVFGLLLLLGVALGAGPLILPLFIMPRSRGARTRETYECGMETIGSAWIRFSVVYYLYALIFLIFEVDVLYLIPVALVYDDPRYGLGAAVGLAVFLLILSLALVFAWRKGVFGPLGARRPAQARRNQTPAGEAA